MRRTIERAFAMKPPSALRAADVGRRVADAVAALRSRCAL